MIDVERELRALGVAAELAARVAGERLVNARQLVLVVGQEHELHERDRLRVAMLDARSGELVTTWDAAVDRVVRLWAARRVVVVASIAEVELPDVEWMISIRRSQFTGYGPLRLDQQLPPTPPTSAVRVEAGDVRRVPVAR